MSKIWKDPDPVGSADETIRVLDKYFYVCQLKSSCVANF